MQILIDLFFFGFVMAFRDFLAIGALMGGEAAGLWTLSVDD